MAKLPNPRGRPSIAFGAIEPGQEVGSCSYELAVSFVDGNRAVAVRGADAVLDPRRLGPGQVGIPATRG